jgi:hypothetical protein
MSNGCEAEGWGHTCSRGEEKKMKQNKDESKKCRKYKNHACGERFSHRKFLRWAQTALARMWSNMSIKSPFSAASKMSGLPSMRAAAAACTHTREVRWCDKEARRGAARQKRSIAAPCTRMTACAFCELRQILISDGERMHSAQASPFIATMYHDARPRLLRIA